MSEKPETFADIIAEMKREAAKIFPALPIAVLQLATRLEAAHLRETVEVSTRAATFAINMKNEEWHQKLGNSAKLREALERVLCWLKRMNAEPLNTLAVSELTPSWAVNRSAKSIIEDNDYHISQLTAALSAPPRNCDLPEVAEGRPIDLAEQAWRVYKRSHKDSYLDAYGLLRCIGWLLAPAAAKEGVAK